MANCSKCGAEATEPANITLAFWGGKQLQALVCKVCAAILYDYLNAFFTRQQ